MAFWSAPPFRGPMYYRSAGELPAAHPARRIMVDTAGIETRDGTKPDPSAILKGVYGRLQWGEIREGYRPADIGRRIRLR